jgi:hypothetical protein
MLCIVSDPYRNLIVGSSSEALTTRSYRAKDNLRNSWSRVLNISQPQTEQEAGRLVL